MNEPETIQNILLNNKTIAVIGLSPNPMRPSHNVALYLKENGYKIVPVNPNAKEILGEKSYPELAAVPFTVDVADVFRRSEYVPAIVSSVIKCGVKALWLQEGVISRDAAYKAEKAGVAVVMDRCMMKEHYRLRSEGKF